MRSALALIVALLVCVVSVSCGSGEPSSQSKGKQASGSKEDQQPSGAKASERPRQAQAPYGCPKHLPVIQEHKIVSKNRADKYGLKITHYSVYTVSQNGVQGIACYLGYKNPAMDAVIVEAQNGPDGEIWPAYAFRTQEYRQQFLNGAAKAIDDMSEETTAQ